MDNQVPKSNTRYSNITSGIQKCHQEPKSTNKYQKVPLGAQKWHMVPKSNTRYPKIPSGTQKYTQVSKSTSRYPKVLTLTQKWQTDGQTDTEVWGGEEGRTEQGNSLGRTEIWKEGLTGSIYRANNSITTRLGCSTKYLFLDVFLQ